LKAVDDALADLGAASGEVKCSTHPKAPHGFSRNASHSSDRYVCECEGWDAYDAGFQAGLARGFDRAHEDDSVDSNQNTIGLPVSKRLTDADAAYILGQLPVPPVGSGSGIHEWAMSAVREISAYGEPVKRAALPGLTTQEYEALVRFCETCDDGEGYDVPKAMMQRLAEVGAVRHFSRGIYGPTRFGCAILDGNVNEPLGKTLEKVEGDLLPPVGSKVLAHLASLDRWVEHEVAGYYVWGDLGGSLSLHRVFVRLIDSGGYPNARMLKDIRPLDFVDTAEEKS
jgi:hypothetical protein